MTATVRIGTARGETLVCVEANDSDPYLTMAVCGQTVVLTRDEARRIGDALRAASLTTGSELG